MLPLLHSFIKRTVKHRAPDPLAVILADEFLTDQEAADLAVFASPVDHSTQGGEARNAHKEEGEEEEGQELLL